MRPQNRVRHGVGVIHQGLTLDICEAIEMGSSGRDQGDERVWYLMNPCDVRRVQLMGVGAHLLQGTAQRNQYALDR